MVGVLWALGFVFALAAGLGAGALVDGAEAGGMMPAVEALLGAETLLLAAIGLTLVTIGAGVLRRLDALVDAARGTVPSPREPR